MPSLPSEFAAITVAGRPPFPLSNRRALGAIPARISARFLPGRESNWTWGNGVEHHGHAANRRIHGAPRRVTVIAG
jgi:hypothetical protein